MLPHRQRPLPPAFLRVVNHFMPVAALFSNGSSAFAVQHGFRFASPGFLVKGVCGGICRRTARRHLSLIKLSVVSTAGSLSTVCISSMIPAIAAVDCVKLGAVI